ncbi:thermonuclease family protein [Ensifer sp. SSB1]|uniref:thermonuclease family protein n=1 Tax=Ensifer sp. SSB1 TaxID=2795385 RepID=UPI001A593DDF|nr:thermonuclease family protein [Ensifer sp. SSB1]MBK5565243.1 thermonuclease family protein [Ensifer sp. SSB1]
MRQHLYTLAGGIAAIALFTGILYAGAAAIRDRESAATPDLVLETPDMTEFETAPDQGETGEDVPLDPDTSSGGAPEPGAATTGEQPQNPATENAGRAIEPQQFGLPDTVTSTPLERVEPRAPLSEQDKQAKSAAEPTILYRPVAVAAGVIQFDKLTLQIGGIEPEQADRTCETGGKSWPCGIVARTAFRNFLRARAVSCDMPEGSAGSSATASCSLGGQDLAAWLVDNGWATPLPGSPLETRADAARQAKLGFYGEDPRDLSHTPMTLDDPTFGTGMDDPQPDL